MRRLPICLLSAFLLHLLVAHPANAQEKSDDGATSSRTFRPVVRGTQYAVSSMKQEATRAAARVLETGGNAFDAIVAGQAVLALVNPEVVWSSDERSVYEEGCLSIPDYYEEVERPARVRVTFRDRNGAECELEADGLLATCLQHEIDHLKGTLFIDHISKLKRDRVVKKFTKLARRDHEL